MSTEQTTPESPQPLATRKPVSLESRVNSPEFAVELQRALASHMKPERFQRIALTAVRRTPKLTQCDPASFFAALLQCAQLGLEPDGRTAHLIPYGTTCQLIVDYKGLIELAMRSGLVSSIFAIEVCEHDQFAWLNGEITHSIDFKRERGEPYAWYARAVMKDGATMTAVMSKADINEIRSKSRSGSTGPWKDHFGEMAKKTVLRRLSKMLVLSPEFRAAEDADMDSQPVTECKPLVTVEAGEQLAIGEGEASLGPV